MPYNRDDKDNNGNGNGNNDKGRGGGRGRGRLLNDDGTEVRSVNHATAGFMSPVKSQGSCGSCWAFTANSVAEGTLAKKTGAAPLKLS